MSMYRQLWLAIVVSTLLALTGSLLASLLSARSYLETQLSMKNTDNAAALALTLSQGKPDAVSVELAVSALFDSGHYEAIRVVDPMERLIVERVVSVDEIDAPAWFAHLLPLRATPGQARITDGWSQFGTVILVSHSRFAYAALWQSALQMLAALALAGLLAGLLGTRILRRLKAPLGAVIEQAKAITERRFVTIEEPRVPELKQLAAAMNATVIRLKTMFAEEAARLESVRREAMCDALTGLANREHGMARLRAVLASEETAGGALLLVRLPDLAGVNRRLGRTVADDYLKLAATRVAACAATRPQGFAARLNGADFGLVLPAETDLAGAAERLREELCTVVAPFLDVEPCVCLGGAHYAPGMPIGELLALADSALAEAEACGRSVSRIAVGGIEHQPGNAEAWARQILGALEAERVKLIAFPVVALDGRSLHVECPLRLKFGDDEEWQPAGRFLPVAERLQLTSQLDLAAVRLGLAELAARRDLAGLAINLSASSLTHASFRPALAVLLAAQPQAARRLWFELPESGALRHLQDLRALCRELKSAGCRVGLEHYGHHFSQIGQLHDLGLDYLKIDASFVRGVAGNLGNAAFLKGLAAIAHSIGLQVIAEGVAHADDLAALGELGFDGATGPGITTPVN